MEFDPWKVNSYTLAEIMEFLNKNECSFQDFQNAGLNYQMQAKVKEELAKVEMLKQQEEERANMIKQQEQASWQEALAQDTVQSYNTYINTWKDNKYAMHLIAAQGRKNELEAAVNDLRSALIEDMKVNPWRYRQDEMRSLFRGVNLADETIRNFLEEQGTELSEFLLSGSKLTYKELLEAGVIPPNVKQSDIVAVDYQMPATQIKDMGDEFPTNRTDVYFLGVPRSGKSSVLAGIIYKLYKDGRAGYEPHLVRGQDPCQAYYQGLIRAISTKKPPQGTASDTVSFMKMNIRSKDDNRKNPVTIVEISGEAFYRLSQKHVTGAEMWSELGARKCITNDNRKLLFFVLDYSVISEKNTNSAISATDQTLALDASLTVFTSDGPDPKNPSKGCTMSKVDTVAVIMTKSDLMDAHTHEERLDIAETYIRENFMNFMNNLCDCCRQYGINRANKFTPYVLAFSLGEFLIGNTVLYNGEDSGEIVDFISAVTRGESHRVFDLFSNWLR